MTSLMDTLTEQDKSSILLQMEQINNKYRDSDIAWFRLIHSVDRAATYVSSEYVTHHLESTSEKVTVISSHCDIAYGYHDADTVLVARLPDFSGIFVLKRYPGKTLRPWNGTEFDKTRTILQTTHKEPPLELPDRLRKRSIISQPETEDPVKRRRPNNRPLTPGSEDSEDSKEEGSIFHDKPGDGVQALALLPPIHRHAVAAIRPQAAQTAQPVEHASNTDQLGIRKTQASTSTVNGSEDDMPEVPLPSTVKISTAYKQAHTTFVFVHKDTGQRSSRAFHLCDSLHKLFRRAQIACTIAPGTSDGALAVNVNGTMKNVAQQDGKDDYREMLEAIWQSAFWTSEDENVMCEVRVRELVLV